MGLPQMGLLPQQMLQHDCLLLLQNQLTVLAAVQTEAALLQLQHLCCTSGVCQHQRSPWLTADRVQY